MMLDSLLNHLGSVEDELGGDVSQETIQEAAGRLGLRAWSRPLAMLQGPGTGPPIAVNSDAMTRATLVEEASRLEVSERIELVEAIWDTLAAHPESLPVPIEHREELDRRLEDLERTPDAGSPWEDVRARLERRDR